MVCFVILHYIALEETVLCVESIRNNVIGEKKIIIIDNASPNGSISDLIKRYKDSDDVDVLGTDTNLGFACGNNVGYKYAVMQYSPEFIVVMNNDMEILQPNFIEEIYKSYEEYKYHIMGPDIYSTKKRYHQNPQIRQLPTKRELELRYYKLWIKDKFRFIIPIKWWIKELIQPKNSREDNLYYANRKYVENVVENPMLHGSCYVFSDLFIKNHQEACFYDKTFMYLEAEILYYLSIKREEKMIYYPNAKVRHHEDVSTDAEFKKQYKKSIFSVKCLLQSSKAFLELMKQYE